MKYGDWVTGSEKFVRLEKPEALEVRSIVDEGEWVVPFAVTTSFGSEKLLESLTLTTSTKVIVETQVSISADEILVAVFLNQQLRETARYSRHGYEFFYLSDAVAGPQLKSLALAEGEKKELTMWTWQGADMSFDQQTVNCTRLASTSRQEETQNGTSTYQIRFVDEATSFYEFVVDDRGVVVHRERINSTQVRSSDLVN